MTTVEPIVHGLCHPDATEVSCGRPVKLIDGIRDALTITIEDLTCKGCIAAEESAQQVIKRLRLGPDDRVVLRTEGPLSKADNVTIRQHVSGVLGIDVSRILVLPASMDIGVIEQETPASG